MISPRLPPGQQLAAAHKWPVVGERSPRISSSPWTVTIAGEVTQTHEWSLEELAALPQIDRAMDIHCVTRWSKLGMRFRGVRLQTVLAFAPPTIEACYVSFVARSQRLHSTSLVLSEALALDPLIVFAANDQPLASEHGGPVRVVVPGRYFYKSLKWLERIELLREDRLGYWEAETGYHNQADPWLEQRYLAPGLTKQQTATLLASRIFASQDLRGIQAARQLLDHLDAHAALLRDADFRRASLIAANFAGANLSNAHLEDSKLVAASFVEADCEGANFQGADLRQANFRGASLFGASFCDELTGQGARFDVHTVIEASAIEQLTPIQAEYVRRQLLAAQG